MLFVNVDEKNLSPQLIPPVLVLLAQNIRSEIYARNRAPIIRDRPAQVLDADASLSPNSPLS